MSFRTDQTRSTVAGGRHISPAAIRTWQGWLYLAVVIDLFARNVVGWSMKPTLEKELVVDALLMVVWRRKPTDTVIVHSDQGSQYGSGDWLWFYREHQLEPSMSRRGNCWDNAVAESLLVRRCDNILREDFPDSFWDAESLFKQIAASGEVIAAVNRQLTALVAKPKDEVRSTGRRLRLDAGKYCVLRLDLVVGEPQYIHTVPYRAFFAPIGARSLHYDQYRLPDTYQNDIFDRSTRLEPGVPGSISPGKYLRVLGDKFAYDFRHKHETLVLKLMTTNVDSLEWLFHKGTRRAHLANDSDVQVTQLRAVVDSLAHFGDESSVEVLAGLADHPNHALRWAVIRTLCRLDPAIGIRALEVAQQDVHPRVREAARSTMLDIEKDAPR